MHVTGFNKRILTFPSFLATVDDVFAHLDDIRAAARAGRVSRAFAERIMLAVTQVHECRYCNYGHTRSALRAGVGEDEIEAIRQGCFDGLPRDEVVALIFAQHYAEQGGHPDPDAWQRLVETYGEQTARDIMAYIRMITFGNLLGNTFDAVISRFRGRPAPGSTLPGELAVFVVGPFVILARVIGQALAGVFAG
jgi:AhpD family alkylhydroperoxidase